MSAQNTWKQPETRHRPSVVQPSALGHHALIFDILSVYLMACDAEWEREHAVPHLMIPSTRMEGATLFSRNADNCHPRYQPVK